MYDLPSTMSVGSKAGRATHISEMCCRICFGGGHKTIPQSMRPRAPGVKFLTRANPCLTDCGKR